ncbi:MAG: DUF11 domain-containing protein [Pseudomonadota bacterium]
MALAIRTGMAGLAAAALFGSFSTAAEATIQFDQDITPEVIFGSGNANGSFTTDRENGVEIGLRAKLRYDEDGQPDNVFNSNGDGTYSFLTRSRPDFPAGQRGEWSFEWSVNTDFDGTTLNNLDDFTYEIGLDGDPGPGTNFLVFDPITPSTEFPCFDHAIGDNATGNGDGVSVNCFTDPDPGNTYQGLLTDNNVAQNSWQYGFFLVDALANYNPRVPGTYTIYLQALDGTTVVARSEIQIIVVDPPLAFDQDITPTFIAGSGIGNGSFTTDRRNDIELAIRAKLRYDDNDQPQNEFRSNGDGSYTFLTRSRPDAPDGQRGEWSFDWGVNTNFNGDVAGQGDDTAPNLDAYTYEIGLDGDPGPGTNYLVFDPITPSVQAPFFDHAIGTNATPNGGGTSAANPAEYLNLLANNNVAHQSWQYGFFLTGPLENYDPRIPGEYSIYLLARDTSDDVVARTEMTVIVVDPPLAFDQDITPDFIAGTGNANGAFTTDRRNDIEIALRGKLRFNAMGQPENTFNSLANGSYFFDAGQAVGQGPQTPIWSFDWGVNTNFNGDVGSAGDQAPNLDGYRYEIGLDGDPSLGTDFLTFDPIIPSAQAPFFDHAIGDNTTPNGGGTSAGDPATYLNLITNNNVAHQSWRYDFFPIGPLANFDPTIPGTYRVYVAAFNGDDVQVARSEIEFLIGGAPSGILADVELSKTTSATGTQFVGDAISYTLTVSNTDLAVATSISLVDELPDNLDFVAGSCDDGTMASDMGQIISFLLADLASGESTVCTLDVVVSGTGVIENAATVSAANDADSSNNAASVRLLGVIESVGETGDMPTGSDNDYTRINDVVQAAQPGDLIILNGLFDWNEPNAFNSWSLGSDGVADTDDDWSILVPDPLSDLTITALMPGDAIIQGPGDVPGVDLEGFLLMLGDHPNTEISNLEINDFDLSIGIFFSSAGLNAYDNLTIVDNVIRMPQDIAGASGAGEAFQNIGIHWAFGDNILIARNVIEIPGDSASTPSLRAANVAMQSNTSGGAYEGLVIEDNEIRVVFAQASNPSNIVGIWENGNSHTSNIVVRNNRFINLDPANDAELNAQQAFRLTSHSSVNSTVLFEGNSAEGANIGYAWLSFDTFGADFTPHQPIEFVSNTSLGNGIGVRLDSNGAANFSCNRIAGNDIGISNITQAERVSVANDNWWGCNAGPNAGACDSFDVGVTADQWLVAAFTAAETTIDARASTDVSFDLTQNSDGQAVSSCTLPATPIDFSADRGTVIPDDSETAAGLIDGVYTAPTTPGNDIARATVDAEELTIDFTIEALVDNLFKDRFEGEL